MSDEAKPTNGQLWAEKFRGQAAEAAVLDYASGGWLRDLTMKLTGSEAGKKLITYMADQLKTGQGLDFNDPATKKMFDEIDASLQKSGRSL